MKTTITPKMAKEFLKNNAINRNLNENNLTFLENEIITGRFEYNGESIIIASDGGLLDGQHRLQAVVNAGIPIIANLVQGVNSNTMGTIDTGRARTSSDLFHIQGTANSVVKSASSRKIMELCGLNKRKYKISNNSIYDFYISNHEEIDYLINRFHTTSRSKILTHSLAVALAYILSIKSNFEDIEITANYIDEILTGEFKTGNNTPLLIRNRIISSKISNTSKLPANLIRNIVINGYNSYFNVRNIKNLSSHHYASPDMSTEITYIQDREG